tara:strand:+ start:2957 stop:3352 length:396 start_codon:yes stop_codon:yes gene_type:complete
MKILGIGVDIIENSRIKKSIINKKFLKRIFTENEILKSKKINNKAGFFSKRFAAKEAFSKALGTGFRDNLQYRDISIINDNYGKPSFNFNSKIKKILFKKFKLKKFKVHLSMSDEKKYSIAYVILENNEKK